MNEQAEQLRQRARRFAVRVLKFVRTLPTDLATVEVARQLAKSGPSESSNYRAACRARSRAEFIAKLGLVVEEADETEDWLEVLHESGVGRGSELDWLRGESRELRAIFKSSLDTARRNHQGTRDKSSSHRK
jgi:four helix bundle protein